MADLSKIVCLEQDCRHGTEQTGGSGSGNDTYTKAEIDSKDADIRAAASEAKSAANNAQSVNQTQDGQIKALQEAVDNLHNYEHPAYSTHQLGFYKFANDAIGSVSDAQPVTKKDITGLGIPSTDDMPFVWDNGSSYKYAKYNGSEHRVIVLDKEFTNAGDILGVSADKTIFLDPFKVNSMDNVEITSSIIAGFEISVKTADTSNKHFRIGGGYITGNRNTFSYTSDYDGKSFAFFNSFIGGDSNKLINDVSSSVIVGSNNFVDRVDYSIVAGYFNEAKKVKNSIVTGYGNKAISDNSIVGGKFNIGHSGVLLELGNGNDVNRSDAFYVTTGGNIFCYGDDTSLNAQIDENTAARHTHSNKTVLDATTASYTTAEKTKVSGIEAGAQKNVQSDWNATSGDAFIKNKPAIPDISGKQDKSTAVTHTANTAVGSATKPVYIAANGAATPITHSINADVPANAKFTDTTYSDATQSAHGLMTAADKKKLDGIAAGATKVAVDSTLSTTSTNPVQNKVVQAALNGKAASGHTHAMITNSALLIAGANNAEKWVRLGTLVSGGDARSAIIRVWSGNGYNAGAYQNASFEIQIKDGYQSTHSAAKACGVTVYRINCSTVKVKVIPTAHNTYTVWVYLPWKYWNGNYAVYGRYTSWTYDGSNQTAEPEGTAADTAYYDQAFLTSTVAKANEATALTETAWTDVPATGAAATVGRSIKYLKSGNTVFVQGAISFNASLNTPVCGTMPSDCLPNRKLVFTGWDIIGAPEAFAIILDTDGKLSFLSPGTTAYWFKDHKAYSFNFSYHIN